MKLRSVELTDWRRFRGGPWRVRFHERGTVVGGPNEAGKSTVFEAVRRALFDRSKTSAAWAKRLPSYGVDGAVPTVSLEFEHAGRVLRIRKEFGRSGRAELFEEEKGEWTLRARNEEAEEQLLDLLGAESGGKRDGTPPESWGPFQWLFVPQDLRALPDEKSDASSRIGLDRAGVSPEFDGIWSRVLEAHEATFLRSGKYRKNSEIQGLADAISELATRHIELAERMEKLARLEREHESIEESMPALREDAEKARAEWETVQEEAVDLSGTEGALKASEAERLRCEAEGAVAVAVLKERLKREKENEGGGEAFREAQKRQVETSAVRDRLGERERDAKEEARRLGDDKNQLQHASSDAKDCLRIRELAQKREEEKERLSRLHELDRKVLEAKAEEIGEPPDARLVRKVERLEAEAGAKRLSLTRAALRVRLEGEPGVEVRLDGKALEGPEGVALEEVRIEAPGGGAVLVEGDTREARTLEAGAESLEEEARTLLEPFGVEDLDALRVLRDARASRREAVERLETRRKDLDPRPTPELEEEEAALEAELAALEAKRESRSPDAGHDGMGLSELKKLVEQLDARILELETRFKNACQRRADVQEEAKEADGEASEADLAYTAAQTAYRGASKELELHRDEHGSLEKCRARESETREALEGARTRERACRKALATLERDLHTRRKTAQTKFDRARERLARQEARADQIRDTLETEGARGSYTRWAEIERSLESERGRLQVLEREAKGLAFLKDVMEEVRRTAVSHAVAPIKEELDELLAWATRSRYRSAWLSDALHPDRLEGEAVCEFEDGSQGLRELVSTLIRLSVARHLSKTEPQAVLLDDPCVHVSRERTVRLVELINRITAGGRVQAIVLTHREHEFAGIEGDVVDLPTQMRCD